MIFGVVSDIRQERNLVKLVVVERPYSHSYGKIQMETSAFDILL